MSRVYTLHLPQAGTNNTNSALLDSMTTLRRLIDENCVYVVHRQQVKRVSLWFTQGMEVQVRGILAQWRAELQAPRGAGGTCCAKMDSLGYLLNTGIVEYDGILYTGMYPTGDEDTQYLNWNGFQFSYREIGRIYPDQFPQ